MKSPWYRTALFGLSLCLSGCGRSPFAPPPHITSLESSKPDDQVIAEYTGDDEMDIVGLPSGTQFVWTCRPVQLKATRRGIPSTG
jgi:hypothetical protein